MKKFLSMVMVLVMVVVMIPVVTVSAETEGYYIYTVENGEATITDFSSSYTGDVVIPDTLGGYPVTSIGEEAFYNCTGLTSITIPDSVTSIEAVAFYKCYSLTSITIGNGVTSIGRGAFNFCTGLTSITIPDSVTSIDEGAFNYCTSLTIITIPDSVTSIGEDAFNYCTSLTIITIPDSVTSIGYEAFYNTGYYNDASNWENDVLYIGNHLIQAKRSISGSYTIKDNTVSIADRAFYNRTGLTSITIPDSVTSIGFCAFSDCTGLTDVYYVGSWASRQNITIGSYNSKLTDVTWHYADDEVLVYEYDDENLSASVKDCAPFAETVVIPGTVTKDDKTYTVTSIGDWAFYNCRALISVTIPDSVTSIGNGAFEYCHNFKGVYYRGSIDEWNSINIGSGNNLLANATVHFVRKNDLGDADGDGSITLTDVTLLLQQIAGWNVEIIGDADANADGNIDLSDVTLLLQHIAGWDVTLG